MRGLQTVFDITAYFNNQKTAEFYWTIAVS